MWTRVAIIATVAVSIGGCGTGVPDQPEFSSYLVLPIAKDQKGNSVYTAPQYTSSVLQQDPESCVEFDSAGAPTVAQRNACIIDLKTDIDSAYDQYEISINNAIAAANTGFDTLALLTGTASPATSGTAAKILSSIAAIANGGKKVFSEDILYKATMQILVSTMKADRAKDAANLGISMQASLDKYPMSQAKNDLLDYLYAGTLTNALAEANLNASAVAQKCQAADRAVKSSVANGNSQTLSKAQAATATATIDAGASTSDQCNQISQTIKAAYSYTGAGRAIEAFWKPDGTTFNAVNENSLKACMKSVIVTSDGDIQNIVTNGDIATLTNTALVSDADKIQVLACAIAASAKVAPAKPKPPVKPKPAAKPNPQLKSK